MFQQIFKFKHPFQNSKIIVIDRWAAQVVHVLEVTYSNGEEMVVQEVKMAAEDNFSFAKKDRNTERQKDLPLKLLLLNVEQNRLQQKSCRKRSAHLINFLYQWWHVLTTISIMLWSLARGSLSSTMEFRRLQFPTSVTKSSTWKVKPDL